MPTKGKFAICIDSDKKRVVEDWIGFEKAQDRMFLTRICWLISAAVMMTTNASSDQWILHSEEHWDNEWKAGDWSYMDKVAVERSKIAVIGGVLVQMYSHSNASVLDVGCGEGPISDFLTAGQKAKYVGMDISKEAIMLAKKKRGSPQKFVQSKAHEFTPRNKFDVIIFSDMLYYADHEKLLEQFENYLNPGGTIIISIFYQTDKKLKHDHIFNFARTTFNLVDELDIGGYTKKRKDKPRERTAFRIEVFKTVRKPK